MGAPNTTSEGEGTGKVRIMQGKSQKKTPAGDGGDLPLSSLGAYPTFRADRWEDCWSY